jgi:Xaa-Pro aminopeptidase
LAAAPDSPIQSPRAQAAARNAMLKERLDQLLPKLMREEGIDMWVLAAREYVEDPALLSMLPAESFNARRLTILVLYDPGEGRPFERLTVSRYGLGELFSAAWNPETQPDQWRALAEVIAARNLKRIAVNVSAGNRFADGLTASLYAALVEALPGELRTRIAASDRLATRWLETRTPAELAAYGEVVRVSHGLIAEAFSAATIAPGATTAADVQWSVRQGMTRRGLAPWFHPTVAVMRRGEKRWRDGEIVILPGDMLHIDLGVTHLSLSSDIQQLGYVLRPGETDAPQGLKDGFKTLHAAGDALTSAFAAGRSGNEVLKRAQDGARAAGVDATFYAHPIGLHGHAAGPSIGFWDNQTPSPAGEDAIRPNTAWAIEFAARRAVPEWDGQIVEFRSEEDAWFDGARVRYFNGRQERFHLIPSGK